jgi:hypothetical protein
MHILNDEKRKPCKEYDMNSDGEKTQIYQGKYHCSAHPEKRHIPFEEPDPARNLHATTTTLA